MPPKNKKNFKKKGTQKWEDETTPKKGVEDETNQNDQGFSESVQEEEKLPETVPTENQTTQPDEASHEKTENTEVTVTTEPEAVKEFENATEPTTAEENIEKNEIQETKPEEQEKEVVNEEPVVEQVSENKIEEEPIVEQVPENKNEEPVLEQTEEKKEEPVIEETENKKDEEPVIEATEERNDEKPAEATEVQSENRLFTIEGEGEQGELNETKGATFGASVITEGNEQESQEVSDRKEEDSSKPLTETTQSVLETNDKEGLLESQGLTTSLQKNWEVMEPQKEVESQETSNFYAPQHQEAAVDLQGSLQQNWEVLGKRSSLVVHGTTENEDIRSDKASDNALQTRLMDDYTESTISISKEPSSLETNPEEKVKKADEQIKEAKVLREQGKVEESLHILLTTFELINPTHFSNTDATLLESVNQRINECTLEIANCYNQLNDFNQSTRYARILLKAQPKDIEANYLLGIGLVRIGDLEEAHNVLKESKKFSSELADDTFVKLIDKELEKLDQIAESKNKTPRNSHYEEQPLLVRSAKGSVDEVPEEKPEENKESKKAEDGKSSGAEYFLGSLVSTSALGFVVSKYLLKFPTRKGLLASLVVGAVVGGVSLIVRSNLGKNDKEKDTKK